MKTVSELESDVALYQKEVRDSRNEPAAMGRLFSATAALKKAKKDAAEASQKAAADGVAADWDAMLKALDAGRISSFADERTHGSIKTAIEIAQRLRPKAA